MPRIKPPEDRRSQNGGLAARVAIAHRQATMQDSRYLRSEVWNALPGSSPVSLEQRDGCHWPIGKDLPFAFCNAEISAGVYCAAHNAISKNDRSKA